MIELLVTLTAIAVVIFLLGYVAGRRVSFVVVRRGSLNIVGGPDWSGADEDLFRLLAGQTLPFQMITLPSGARYTCEEFEALSSYYVDEKEGTNTDEK